MEKNRPKLPKNPKGIAGLAQVIKYFIEIKMIEEEANPSGNVKKATGIVGKLQ